MGLIELFSFFLLAISAISAFKTVQLTIISRNQDLETHAPHLVATGLEFNFLRFKSALMSPGLKLNLQNVGKRHAEEVRADVLIRQLKHTADAPDGLIIGSERVEIGEMVPDQSVNHNVGAYEDSRSDDGSVKITHTAIEETNSLEDRIWAAPGIEIFICVSWRDRFLNVTTKRDYYYTAWPGILPEVARSISEPLFCEPTIVDGPRKLIKEYYEKNKVELFENKKDKLFEKN